MLCGACACCRPTVWTGWCCWRCRQGRLILGVIRTRVRVHECRWGGCSSCANRCGGVGVAVGDSVHGQQGHHVRERVVGNSWGMPPLAGHHLAILPYAWSLCIHTRSAACTAAMKERELRCKPTWDSPDLRHLPPATNSAGCCCCCYCCCCREVAAGWSCARIQCWCQAVTLRLRLTGRCSTLAQQQGQQGLARHEQQHQAALAAVTAAAALQQAAVP